MPALAAAHVAASAWMPTDSIKINPSRAPALTAQSMPLTETILILASWFIVFLDPLLPRRSSVFQRPNPEQGLDRYDRAAVPYQDVHRRGLGQPRPDFVLDRRRNAAQGLQPGGDKQRGGLARAGRQRLALQQLAQDQLGSGGEDHHARIGSPADDTLWVEKRRIRLLEGARSMSRAQRELLDAAQGQLRGRLRELLRDEIEQRIRHRREERCG